MWPFREKETKTKIDGTKKAVDELKAFRDIGETFNYLGITCIVTGHCEYLGMIGFVPILICDYVDGRGQIRQAKFSLRELPGLIKQQESNAVLTRERTK